MDFPSLLVAPQSLSPFCFASLQSLLNMWVGIFGVISCFQHSFPQPDQEGRICSAHLGAKVTKEDLGWVQVGRDIPEMPLLNFPSDPSPGQIGTAGGCLHPLEKMIPAPPDGLIQPRITAMGAGGCCRQQEPGRLQGDAIPQLSGAALRRFRLAPAERQRWALLPIPSHPAGEISVPALPALPAEAQHTLGN